MTPTTDIPLSTAARAYLAHGLSLLPIKPGSKSPASLLLPRIADDTGKLKPSWEPYKTQPPSFEDLDCWLDANINAIAVVGGQVSGGLLILDFDDPDFFHAWHQQVDHLLEDMPIQCTGGGGFQVALRCPDPGPNQKLAWKRDETVTTGKSVAIETRGEGGYAILAPSLHPSGQYYRMYQGNFSAIPLVDQAVADQLLEAARGLNQVEDETKALSPHSPKGLQPGQIDIIGGFNHQVKIGEILERFGYKRSGKRYIRPEGTNPSVAIDEQANRSFHHSTNDLLNDGYWQLPFSVIYKLEHNQNISLAVKAAAQELGLDTIERAESNGLAPADEILAQVSEDRSYLLSEGADDSGNAQCLHRLYGPRFLYTSAYGWVSYNSRYWETDPATADAQLTQAANDALKQRRLLAVEYTNASQQGGGNFEHVIKAAKPSATNIKNAKYIFKSHVTTKADTFDSHPDLLNCANGVLNLRTLQMETHAPSQRFTYCLPVAYDSQADFTPWVEFLRAVVVEPGQMVDFLQQAVGYSITGHTIENCMFYIYGPTRSGKGTFTDTLMTMLGKPLAAETNFSTFTAVRAGDTQNFDLAPLKPARFLVANESNRYEKFNSSLLKRATGGDRIRCAFKHQTPFEYKPQFVIWLATNFPVNADVDDEALWNRLKVIEFPHSFAGKEDKQLKYRLQQPQMLGGILTWAVLGAHRWYQSQPGLLTPPVVQTTTKKHRDDLDDVQQWLDEYTVRAEEAHWVANYMVYQSYKNFCEQNGIKPKHKTHLGQTLTNKGFITGARVRDDSGKQLRVVKGIQLIEFVGE